MNSQDAINKLHSVIMEALERDGSFSYDTDENTIWVDVSEKETVAISINECVSQDK